MKNIACAFMLVALTLTLVSAGEDTQDLGDTERNTFGPRGEVTFVENEQNIAAGELLGTDPDHDSDLHYYSPKVNGKIARSAFGNHAYVLIDGSVVDATVGPVKPSDGKDVSGYLAEVRDTSTEDEEKLPHPFNLDVEEIARPVLDSGDTYSTKLDKRQ